VKTNLTVIGAAVALVLAIAGALIGVDKWGHTNFLSCEAAAQIQQQVHQQGQRLDQKIDNDRRDKLQERNWTMESKYNTRDPLKMPTDARTEYQRNQLEMMKLDEKWKGK
jgi:hypothetical protein